MKKLLVVLTVVATAFVVNAASFKWTAANIYGPDGSKMNGSADLYAYLATADASTAVKVDTATVTDGVVKDGTTVGKVFSDDSLAAGSAYNFYIVIQDGGKEFTSGLKSATGAEVGNANIAFGNMATATQNADNWANVPEPTSALLLMLGVAGLALKRKRV